MRENGALSKGRSLFILFQYMFGYNYLYPLLIEHLARGGIGSRRTLPYEIAVYVFVFITTLIAGWPLVSYGWKRFVERFPRNAKIVLLSMIGLYAVTVATTMVVYQIVGEGSSMNQMEVQFMFRRTPLFVALIACVFAPVVEELVFRGSVFTSLKAKGHVIWGIILSSVLFGFVHVFSSLLAGDYFDLVYMLVYSGMGLVFGIICHRTDSIVASMLVHLLNNAISLLIL